MKSEEIKTWKKESFSLFQAWRALSAEDAYAPKDDESKDAWDKASADLRKIWNDLTEEQYSAIYGGLYSRFHPLGCIFAGWLSSPIYTHT